MSRFLGIDLGTSYFKAALFDERGNLAGLGRAAVRYATPAPGRCELAVPQFWSVLREAVHGALTQAGTEAREIAGLSYSSQANTFLLLDAADQPLTPLISWLDTRGEGLEPALVAFSHSEVFQATVGFGGLSGQFAMSKWHWFQRHEPAVWARARRVMTISDYLTFALTGERVGDAGTAAFLGALDLARRAWWPAALGAFGIEAEKLSRPLAPGSPCGKTSARAGELLGLPAGLPFAVGALDHHAGAIGAGLGGVADVSITTGTVLAALALVDEVTRRRDCFHGPHVDGTRCYCLAFDPAGAGSLEEYQRAFAPDATIGQLLAMAETPADNSAAIHGAAIRDLLGKIARTHQRLLKQVGATAAKPNVLATGGGARSPLWLRVKADTLGRPIVTSRSPEPGCLGAAMFAAAAGGQFPSITEAQAAMARFSEPVFPAPKSE
ncbi:MAG: hypothetical protein RLZZ15_554 [Verrucomicrobiota bacterium]|jgi:sugar (pentulose or hexulose) kinase